MNRVRGRILLAEDTPDNQKLLRIYLERVGAQVTIVDNGASAVETARAQEFDLVLMDMQMPILDGLGAVRELRNGDYERPIVALTANAMKDDRVRCLDGGCNDFLTKPINRDDLYEVVYTYLPLADAEDDGPIISLLLEDSPELSELIQSFASRLPELIQPLRDATDQKQWDELERVSHRIKGAGGGYGFPLVSQLGDDIGNALLDGDYRRVEEMISRLEVVAARVARGADRGAATDAA